MTAPAIGSKARKGAASRRQPKAAANEAPPRSTFLRVAFLVVCLAAAAFLFRTAYHESELWKVASADGSATVLVGQQPWFGLAGVDLVRRRLDPAGRQLGARVVGHYPFWSDAQQRANVLHRVAYGYDSPLYFQQSIRPLLAGIASDAPLQAYEGVPHSHWPRPLLVREATGQPLTLGDFLFFKTPAPIEPEDVSRLAALCSAETTFGPYRGPQSSATFRPDWCLLWKRPQDECRVVLCFECRQARLYGPKEGIWSELDDEALRQFGAILKPYQGERLSRY
jgi:hypothetical protein